jgi:hydroxylamine reductase
MFCYQCQEAAKGTGCTLAGVCGKKPEVANLQDLLIYTMKGISILANEARTKDINLNKVDEFIMNGLFMTITNANFDEEAFYKTIKEGLVLRDKLKSELEEKDIHVNNLHDSITWTANSNNEIEAKADSVLVGVLSTENEDVRSLRE